VQKARTLGHLDLRVCLQDVAEHGDERRVALLVRGGDAHGVDVAAGEQRAHARDDRPADPLVGLVHDLDAVGEARPVTFGDLPGAIL
jgi:hypothetical protein